MIYTRIYKNSITGVIEHVACQDTPFLHEMIEVDMSTAIPVLIDGVPTVPELLAESHELDTGGANLTAREVLDNFEVLPNGELMPRNDASQELKNKIKGSAKRVGL